MNLIDTNIFLEILLQQEKSKLCKQFLIDNKSNLNISDFSLHSIGVILFRQNEEETYLNFINDILPSTNLVHLPMSAYSELVTVKQEYNLDFDDSYQYLVCKTFSYDLVTMDNDFKKIKDINIKYL